MRSALFFLLAAPALAQSVRILSEFRRVDTAGHILRQDQGGQPREILSPAMARNAYHSLRVVVTMPAGQWYTLYISQNPDDATRINLYREKGDLLEPVKLPVQNKSDGSAETFWLDVFVPALAHVRRIRLEAQLHDGTGWVIAPMEVRIIAAIAPQHTTRDVELPSPSLPADAPARAVLREYFCGDPTPRPAPAARNPRSLIRRNAAQDIALAQAVEKNMGRNELAQSIAQAAGFADAAAMCEPRSAISPLGPEWYLRVRDFLYREASR